MTKWIAFSACLMAATLPLGGAASAQERRVRIELASGEVVEGVLADGERAYRVRLADGREVVVREDELRRLELLPALSDRGAADVLEGTPRLDWRFDAPAERVVAYLARAAGRSLELDPRLEGAAVRLEVPDATWRGALRKVAGRLGAGLEEEPSGALRVTPDAVEPPFRLVSEVAAGAPPADLPRDDQAARTAARDAAEARGIAWLASALQRPNDREVIPTSLALLALLDRGHTHRSGSFKPAVMAGLRWLREQQREDGSFVAAPGDPAPVLTQALASWAVCEAYAVSRDFTLKRAADQALAALLALETPSGGWGLTPDVSAPNVLGTLFAVRALGAARVTGGEVPDEVWARAGRLFAAVSDDEGRAGYRRPGHGISLTLGPLAQAPEVPLFSAAAAAGRLLSGERPVAPLQRAAAHLTLPRAERFDPLYAGLGAYAALAAGGELWGSWEPSLTAVLLATQEPGDPATEPLGGSWPPAGLLGDLGGRVGTTAGALLAIGILDLPRRSYPRSPTPEGAEAPPEADGR